jgi:hypothetical protein
MESFQDPLVFAAATDSLAHMSVTPKATAAELRRSEGMGLLGT